MQPAHALPAEDIVPIKIARLELRGGRVPAVWYANRAANAESALGEIQTVAHRAAHAVIGPPFDERRIHAALQNEIFNQSADVIVRERGAHCRAHAEAAAQTA